MTSSISDRLRAEAEACGFDAFGIARADSIPRAPERLRAWLSSGCQGDMGWMETRSGERSDPTALWAEVRSIIMLGKSYAPLVDPLRNADRPDVGVISVYAGNRDYHDVVKRDLKRLARWLAGETAAEVKVFVDTAPVMEKPLAAAAGLGWQGKHTNLVSRSHGSWLFLGAIYTTLDLPPAAPHADRCGRCTACQTACPTDAFPAPYRLDARRCISYLTIEHKGPIPEELRTGIGNRIYGCDDCLAVCPWNKFAKAASEIAFGTRAELMAPRLADLLQLDDGSFRELFRGSPVKRIGRDRFVRNCLIAAGNSGDPELVGQVRHLLSDAAPLVRGAAVWALWRLSPTEAAESRSQALETEREADVRAEWAGGSGESF